MSWRRVSISGFLLAGVRVAHLFSFSVFCLLVFVLCLVCPMLPVSLDCPFLITPSVFSNVYLRYIQRSIKKVKDDPSKEPIKLNSVQWFSEKTDTQNTRTQTTVVNIWSIYTLLPHFLNERVSCKKQRRLTLREHTEFTSEFLGRVCVPHLFSFLCCPITCPSVVSSVLWCPIRFPHQQQNLCLYLTLFVVGLMSYLPYLCLFVVGLMSYLPYLCLSLSHAVCSRAHVLFTLFVFVFTSCCLQQGSCLIYVICVCLRKVVSNTYCVVFLLCFSTSCCQFL